MKKVFKYPLSIVDLQTVTLPIGAKILCIKLQNEEPCLWALVDPSLDEKETVNIRCAGTGHPIDEEIEEYIDTVILMNGRLVFHFFKVK